MQERAAVGLTLIETFWNFFLWQKWGKTLQKGQKRGKKRVDYRSLLFSLMMFNTLKISKTLMSQIVVIFALTCSGCIVLSY
ncbi:hypothetical protein [Escherichia coli]|uniref:hypothetical protein n=1 Tax=Escherichia coli TaxID=562 RepID=UPI003D8C6216